MDNNDHALPAIKSISVSDPLRWLAAGWSDIHNSGYRSIWYGVVFVIMGYVIVWMYKTQWQLVMGLISGFFLMGPFICAGIYDLSRQLHRGDQPSLVMSLTCWRKNIGSIAFFAVILTFAMIVWARVSVIIFALFSTTDFPTLKGILQAVFSLQNSAFLLVWLGVGFMFASVVFAISAVSVPMMLDRNCDTIAAVFTSVRTILKNTLPMYVWAVLVVSIVGLSLFFGFVPLILTAPLVGHATWHAYRQLVAE